MLCPICVHFQTPKRLSTGTRTSPWGPTSMSRVPLQFLIQLVAHDVPSRKTIKCVNILLPSRFFFPLTFRFLSSVCRRAPPSSPRRNEGTISSLRLGYSSLIRAVNCRTLLPLAIWRSANGTEELSLFLSNIADRQNKKQSLKSNSGIIRRSDGFLK